MDIRKPFDPSPDILVHGVEINRDQNAFAVACEDGFRLYDTESCALRCYRDFAGSIKFATILETTNIIGLLGANKGAPKTCPKDEVIIWDNSKNNAALGVSDSHSRPLRILLSRKLMVPVCETGLAIFKLTSSATFGSGACLQSYSTTANPHAVSVLGSRILAFPGISKGKLQVVDLKTMKSAIINVHTSHLRAIALSADEELLATASDKGTLVRVWSTISHSKVAEFRRGIEESAIFNIAFSPAGDLLALTSGKGTIHIFVLNPESIGESARVSSIGQNVQNAPKAGTRHQRSDTSRQRDNDREHSRLEDLSQSMLFDSFESTEHMFDHPIPQNVQAALQPTKKSARFNDSRPASVISRDQFGHAAPNYAQSIVSTGSTTSSSAGANKAHKYGAFATLPFAPRVLRDQYSVCSTSFHLPGRVLEVDSLDDDALYTPPPTIPPPTVGSSSHRRLPSAPQGKNLMQGLSRPSSLAQGAPPKGQIAWISDSELVVICAGRGGRWEKFEIQRRLDDDKIIWSIRRVAWKAYLDEEGG